MQTAKDMDRIRGAVGNKPLNYLGFSYGTELGSVYAHLYPEHVGVAVLDGAVDPLTDDITSFANQLKGFEGAFDQFQANCLTRSPCKSLGNPRQVVYDLVKQANQSPLKSSKSGEDRTATGSIVLTGVLSALYRQSDWPALGQALIDAKAGDAKGLFRLADSYNQRGPDGHYTNISDANTTINCNDSKPGPSDDTIKATAIKWVKDYPMFGRWSAPSLFSCQVWQPDRTPVPLPSAPTPHKVLVDRQPARPGHPVPGRDRPGQDDGQRRAAVVGRRGAHVLPAGQHLHRQLRRRLPDQRHRPAAEHDVPAVSPEPKLTVDVPDGPVHAVALVLHGGRSHGTGRVRASQLAVLRMVPFAKHLRRAGAVNGLAVARLRYVQRGWNGAEQAPLADARWALAELERRFPGVPVGLVGHSMGGRTALYVADHPDRARGRGPRAVDRAGDPVSQLAGRRVLIAHGTLDRMTSPPASAAYARAAALVADSVSYVSVQDERHAMLRRAGVWHELATGFLLGVLCARAPDGTAEPETTNVLTKALAGQASLVV